MAGGTATDDMLERAVEVLVRRLPSAWTVERLEQGDAGADLVVGSGYGTQARLFVEVKAAVSPRDVEALVGGPWRRWRSQLGNPTIVLIAPYVGPGVRRLLADEGVGYIDLTGNIRLSVSSPALFIETSGADRDPTVGKARAGVRGAKAGAVVRSLVDIAPPYPGSELARVAGVDQGYLSRILDTLVSEGFVERERAGAILRVDWPALVRRRAQALDLFRTGAHRFVARRGTEDVLERLRDRPGGERPPTVTGSYAAARVAPVAAPALLVVYSMDPTGLARELDLLPADAGADTVLVRPENEVVFARARREGGMAWAAVSQVAIDCLAGTGRMPAEGEALVRWMGEHSDEWRLPGMAAAQSDAAGVNPGA